MRLLVVKLLVLIIAVTSLHMKLDLGMSFNTKGADSIASLPLLDINTIASPSNKLTQEVEIVSYVIEESAFLVFSETIKSIPFLYYLPIYSLVRAKEYLLLI